VEQIEGEKIVFLQETAEGQSILFYFFFKECPLNEKGLKHQKAFSSFGVFKQ